MTRRHRARAAGRRRERIGDGRKGAKRPKREPVAASSPAEGGGRARRRPPTFFVTTIPGLGEIAAQEVEGVTGLRAGRRGGDGRADVLTIITEDAASTPRALSLGTVEDVFATIATVRAGQPVGAVAATALGEDALGRALRLRDRLLGRPLRRKPTARVIARLRDERRYRRTQLRDTLRRRLFELRPGWRPGDPAEVEIWALQWQRDEIVVGLRLTGARMRQGGGRAAERTGALRPAVARAMLTLVGPPRGRLLDPCCGSGTLLGEAAALGWEAAGFDIDRGAVDATRRNARDAEVARGDVRDLPLPDASIDAVVSNLPFGAQYGMQGDPATWLGAAARELVRVTRPGGPIVLLHPDRPPPPPGCEIRPQAKITLLGRRATIWLLRARAG